MKLVIQLTFKEQPHSVQVTDKGACLIGVCGGMQSDFARRLEKAEHEWKWKLDQQLDSLSDASKTHLRQVSPHYPPLPPPLPFFFNPSGVKS